jgi:hypothetical protein
MTEVQRKGKRRGYRLLGDEWQRHVGINKFMNWIFSATGQCRASRLFPSSLLHCIHASQELWFSHDDPTLGTHGLHGITGYDS